VKNELELDVVGVDAMPCRLDGVDAAA